MEESKFPYVNNYGKISELFEKIANAPEPSKLTQEGLYKILARKSTSDRPFIAFLKRLKFLDDGNSPTSYYRDYREKTKSKAVMAKCIKDVYADVYSTHEKLHDLDKTQVTEKFKIITGLGSESKVLNSIVSTFISLKELADFKTELKEEKPNVTKEIEEESDEGTTIEIGKRFGFSYTINLNLPPTTDQRVYNAIFKSLKENLFK